MFKVFEAIELKTGLTEGPMLPKTGNENEDEDCKVGKLEGVV
jgi:hypothetical protein